MDAATRTPTTATSVTHSALDEQLLAVVTGRRVARSEVRDLRRVLGRLLSSPPVFTVATGQDAAGGVCRLRIVDGPLGCGTAALHYTEVVAAAASKLQISNFGRSSKVRLAMRDLAAAAAMTLAPRLADGARSPVVQAVLNWVSAATDRIVSGTSLFEFSHREALATALLDWQRSNTDALLRQWREYCLHHAAFEVALGIENDLGIDGIAIYNRLVENASTLPSTRRNTARNRAQFAGSRSVLAEFWLFAERGADDDRAHESIGAAVDDGESLRDLLVEGWGTSAKAASWLLCPRDGWPNLAIGTHARDGEALMRFEDLRWMKRVLAQLPPEYWPRDREELNICGRLIGRDLVGVGTMARELELDLFPLIHPMLSVHGWKGLVNEAGLVARPELNHIADIWHAVEILRSVVHWGIGRHAPDSARIVRERLSDALVSGWLRARQMSSLVKIAGDIEVACAEAERQIAVHIKVPPAPRHAGMPVMPRTSLSWSPLMQVGTKSHVIHGVEFSERCSVADLVVEGEQMMHCVGSYGHRCVMGQAHIFHMKRGSHQATLMVGVHKDEFSILQIRGARNRVADVGCQSAATELVRLLNAGAVPRFRMEEHLSAGRRAGSSALSRHQQEKEKSVAAREALRSTLLDPMLRALLPASVRADTFAASLVVALGQRRNR